MILGSNNRMRRNFAQVCVIIVGCLQIQMFAVNNNPNSPPNDFSSTKKAGKKKKSIPSVAEIHSIPLTMATTSNAPALNCSEVSFLFNRFFSCFCPQSCANGFWYDPRTLTPKPMEDIFDELNQGQQPENEIRTPSPISQVGSMELSLSEAGMESLFLTPHDREIFANVKTIRQSVETTDVYLLMRMS